MKKTVLFFVLLAAVSMSCAAQTGGNEQRLVGSWTHVVHDDTVVFNANGTVTGWQEAMGGANRTHWVAAGNRLFLFVPNGGATTLEFAISTDGRTLIVHVIGGDGTWGNAFRRN